MHAGMYRAFVMGAVGAWVEGGAGGWFECRNSAMETGTGRAASFCASLLQGPCLLWRGYSKAAKIPGKFKFAISEL